MKQSDVDEQIRTRQRDRLSGALGWHVRHQDVDLSDDELVRAVVNRYLAHRGLMLIDPNE